MSKILAAAVLCATLSPLSAFAETAASQPAAQAASRKATPGVLTFAAHNQRYKAEGKFESWHFTKVDIPHGDIEKGTVELEIDLASVWEKADKLAAHLRTPDFFDVEKFAKATVSIAGAKKNDDGSYDATATVNFHGMTSDVPVQFKVTGNHPMAFAGTATLKRTAFGLGGGPYDPSSEGSITDDIAITLEGKLPHDHKH